LIRISVTPSDMGDGLFVESKRSNFTFIRLLIQEMDVDYLVVEEMVNRSKLFDYTCMLRIRCKPMILITQSWLITCLKVLKASCCRLMYHLPLEAFACLEV
jgi:hypothetical protein